MKTFYTLLCRPVVFLVLISGASYAHAQQAVPDLDPLSALRIDHLEDSDSELSKIVLKFEEEVKKQWPAQSSAMQREINRYKIKAHIGGTDKDLSASSPIIYDARYEAVVEPNFLNGEQVRRDIYTFGIGLKKDFDILKTLSGEKKVYGKVSIRLSFSRVFRGPKAKLNAILSWPYWPSRVPLNADGFKNKLAVGNGFRIEIFGNVGLAFGREWDQVRGGYMTASISAEQQALFMLEGYRHSETIMRLRVLGLKNWGILAGDLQAKLFPFSKATHADSKSFVDRAREWAHVAINTGVRDTPEFFGFNEYPIDTMMVDYVYNFEKAGPGVASADSAEAAMNQIFDSTKHLGFLPLFEIFKRRENIGETLKERASLSERLAREDFGKGTDARVRHLFKGRIESTLLGGKAGYDVSILASAEGSIGSMSSYVIAEDTFGKKNYYLLESATSHTKTQYLANRSQNEDLNDFNILLKSDEKKGAGPLLDIVLESEIHDKHMSPSELTRHKEELFNILPPTIKTPAVLNFFPTTDQNSAYLRSRFSYGAFAFASMQKISKPEMFQRLYEFLDKHPDRQFMHLPSDVNKQTGMSLSEFSDQLSTEIYEVFSGVTYEDRLDAFHRIKGLPIFRRYLLGEFFMTLLPIQVAKEQMGLLLQFSSEQTPTKAVEVGSNKVSSVYRFAQILKSVLENRSYDLRLETIINQDGTKTLMTPEQLGSGLPASEFAR